MVCGVNAGVSWGLPLGVMETAGEVPPAPFTLPVGVAAEGGAQDPEGE